MSSLRSVMSVKPKGCCARKVPYKRPSARARLATEETARSPQRSSYGKRGISLMQIPAHTTRPPVRVALSAFGTSTSCSCGTGMGSYPGAVPASVRAAAWLPSPSH